MMDAFKTKAKGCCAKEYNRLVSRLSACEKDSNSADERHACYRRAAKTSGRRAKECIAG